MNKGIATGRDRDSCPFNVSVGMEGKDINGHGPRSRITDLALIKKGIAKEG